jgi:hypothetical protein
MAERMATEVAESVANTVAATTSHRCGQDRRGHHEENIDG